MMGLKYEQSIQRLQYAGKKWMRPGVARIDVSGIKSLFQYHDGSVQEL